MQEKLKKYFPHCWKTENLKNKVPLLASASVFLAHKEKESKVHIPLISYFVSYAK